MGQLRKGASAIHHLYLLSINVEGGMLSSLGSPEVHYHLLVPEVELLLDFRFRFEMSHLPSLES